MTLYTRTLKCVCLNVASLIPIFIFVFINAKWEFGPSENLAVIGVQVDTWPKYVTLVILSSILKIIEVALNDIGSPNLGFTIYDPTRTKVYGFTRSQLEILANLMWASNSLGNVFRVMIMVSRLDVALMSTVAGEFTSCVVVHYLLNQKKEFNPNFDTEDEFKEFENAECTFNDL